MAHGADLLQPRCLAPSPMASIATTELTPMTMPSSVSTVRKMFALSARVAMRRDSLSPENSARLEIPFARSGISGELLSAGPLRLPLSLVISPSLISITRFACAATLASWVIRMTVWPSAARSSSRAITSAPLLLQRARRSSAGDLAAIPQRTAWTLLLLAADLRPVRSRSPSRATREAGPPAAVYLLCDKTRLDRGNSTFSSAVAVCADCISEHEAKARAAGKASASNQLRTSAAKKYSPRRAVEQRGCHQRDLPLAGRAHMATTSPGRIDMTRP